MIRGESNQKRRLIGMDYGDDRAVRIAVPPPHPGGAALGIGERIEPPELTPRGGIHREELELRGGAVHHAVDDPRPSICHGRHGLSRVMSRVRNRGKADFIVLSRGHGSPPRGRGWAKFQAQSSKPKHPTLNVPLSRLGRAWDDFGTGLGRVRGQESSMFTGFGTMGRLATPWGGVERVLGPGNW